MREVAEHLAAEPTKTEAARPNSSTDYAVLGGARFLECSQGAATPPAALNRSLDGAPSALAYVRTTTPVLVAVESTRRSVASLLSAKRRLPAPTATG